MADDTPPAREQEGAEGEPGRENVAGRREGQPGYDLDESKAYEAAQEDEDPASDR